MLAAQGAPVEREVSKQRAGLLRRRQGKTDAAPDDLDTVVGWLRREGPPGPYAAHGDSAGANLALVAALRNPGFFRVVALVYPFLDPRCAFPSWSEGPGSGFSPAESICLA